MARPSDLIQGTLDLLILKTISLEPVHGWAIAKRIQQASNDVLLVQQGSLYPSGDTSKAAIKGHFKSRHFRAARVTRFIPCRKDLRQ